MTSKLISGSLISERYASALYDFASESKSIDAVLNDINFLQKSFEESKDLKLIIKSPLIKSKDKFKILVTILEYANSNKITSIFLQVLEKNRRFSNLYPIILQFIKINSERRGDILADITSANELNEDQKNIITKQLKNILGDKLSLNFDVDKKIIGGLVVKVGSKMIDNSLANKINKLKIAMEVA